VETWGFGWSTPLLGTVFKVFMHYFIIIGEVGTLHMKIILLMMVGWGSYMAQLSRVHLS
jgi:hypothetical protein